MCLMSEAGPLPSLPSAVLVDMVLVVLVLCGRAATCQSAIFSRRIAAVELDVDTAGGERAVIEVTAVRVVKCLGELADHLQPGL